MSCKIVAISALVLVLGKLVSPDLIASRDTKALWLNVTKLFQHARRLSIVRNEMGGTDFETVLIKHMNRLKPLPLVMTNGGCEFEDRLSEGGKQIVFSLYESVQHLYDSWTNLERLMTCNSKRSFYFLIVLSESMDEVGCQDADMIDVLKDVVGNLFDRMWRDIKVLEVTVVFPNLCNEQFTLRYDPIKVSAGNYTNGVSLLNEDSDPALYLHDYRNFEEYPIIINIFYRTPTLIKTMPESSWEAYEKDVKNLEGMGGLDGYALGNMVNRLNFTPILKESADRAEYGYRKPDNTFSGSIGDIINKNMDISMNARFIKIYGTDKIEFTCPVYYDEFCVLAPKSLTIPTWMSIFLVFSIEVWCVIGLTFLASSTVWWLMKTKFPSDPRKKSTSPQCFLFLDIGLLLVSGPLLVLPTINRERLLVTACFIFNLIFVGLFQGYLSTAYSTTSYYDDINTLAQLDKSGLPISTKNSDIFGVNVTRVGQSLTQKIIVDQKDSARIAAEKRSITVVERSTDADLLISLNFTGKDGQPKLHVVNECPRSYHLAYIVYKGYPFLEAIDRFFQRAVEAGLNNKWYQDTKFSLLLKSHQMEETMVLTKKLDMTDVQTSFFLLIYGLTVSVVVFVLEIVTNYIKKARQRRIERKQAPELYRYEIFIK